MRQHNSCSLKKKFRGGEDKHFKGATQNVFLFQKVSTLN